MKILVIVSLLFLSACETNKQKEDRFWGGISQELSKKYD